MPNEDAVKSLLVHAQFVRLRPKGKDCPCNECWKILRESLSANLRGLRGTFRASSPDGEDHYYHIRNLSAIVFDHDKNQKQKYKQWAGHLFEEGRQLRQQTYFWARA